MTRLEFTDEEFNNILHRAQELYLSIGHVRCPYFRAEIQFNPSGLEHLRRKAWNRGRSRNDQFMRLKHLWMAPTILSLSSTVQGIYHTHERIRRHRHGRWEETFSPVTFYEFVAVHESRRFKVIVKQSSGQGLMFWSLIPFWRQSEQGSRLLHDGNPMED